MEPRRGAYVHLTDEELGELPVENLTPLDFEEYYRRMLASVKQTTPFFELPLPELHKKLAREGVLPENGYAGPKRLYLPNACRIEGHALAERRIDVVTPYAINRLVLPDFYSDLQAVLLSMKEDTDTQPVAATLTRQYAHDLILTAAITASESPLPYCSQHMMLLYTLYRWLADPTKEEKDNVYAAAINPSMTLLRKMMLDPVKRAQIIVRLQKRTLFTKKSHVISWEPIQSSLSGYFTREDDE